jgi:hypothetical protein
MQIVKENIYIVATKKKVVLHVIQTSAIEIKPFARMGNGGATFQLWHNQFTHIEISNMIK